MKPFVYKGRIIQTGSAKADPWLCKVLGLQLVGCPVMSATGAGAQVRGLASGAAATSNWVANAVVSQTFLTLTQRLGGSGAFWLYSCIATGGLVWVYFMLPETNGAHGFRVHT